MQRFNLTDSIGQIKGSIILDSVSVSYIEDGGKYELSVCINQATGKVVEFSLIPKLVVDVSIPDHYKEADNVPTEASSRGSVAPFT